LLIIIVTYRKVNILHGNDNFADVMIVINGHMNQWLKQVGTRGNAVPGLASVPRPHTAVNGTSTLRGAPSAYSRAPSFFESSWTPNLYFNH